MYGYIYKTTNLINGKIYVGQKKSTIFLQDYKGSGKKLRLALQKYSIDNFIVELLEVCNSIDELNQQEAFWIDKLDCRNPKVGYNIALGGNVGGFNKGYKLTEEHRRNISKGLQGHRLSEQTKQKLSKAKKHTTVSNEIKQKISIQTKKAMQKPEIRDKCRQGGYSHKGKKRKPLTDEQKQKISIATKLGIAKAKERRLSNEYYNF